jgi:hypothetical protein
MLRIGVLLIDGGRRPPLPPPFRGRIRFGEAVDRFLADEGVDSGIEVEGDKLAGVFACRNHGKCESRRDDESMKHFFCALRLREMRSRP